MPPQPLAVGLGLLLAILTGFVFLYGWLAHTSGSWEHTEIGVVLGGALITSLVFSVLKKLCADLAHVADTPAVRLFESLVVPGTVMVAGFLKFTKMLGAPVRFWSDTPALMLAGALLIAMSDPGRKIRTAIAASRLFEVRGGGWDRILYKNYPPESISDLIGFICIAIGIVAYAVLSG